MDCHENPADLLAMTAFVLLESLNAVESLLDSAVILVDSANLVESFIKAFIFVLFVWL